MPVYAYFGSSVGTVAVSWRRHLNSVDTAVPFLVLVATRTLARLSERLRSAGGATWNYTYLSHHGTLAVPVATRYPCWCLWDHVLWYVCRPLRLADSAIID